MYKIFILEWIHECFLLKLTQERCQKILDSAVPHPDDKNIIQQIAAGYDCPSTSRTDPHWPWYPWINPGWDYQVI